MRITTQSKLTASDVREAASFARERGQDIYVEEIATSPRGAVTFYCEAEHGRYATNRQGRGGSTGRAATWTAWGWLIAELFRRDPDARIGQYRGVDDFRRQCSEMRQHHDFRRRAGVSRKAEPGEDISFLEHVAYTSRTVEDHA